MSAIRRITPRALVALSAILFCTNGAGAQSEVTDSLRREIDELRQGQIVLLRELRDVRQQLARAKSSRDVIAPVESRMIDVGGPAIGRPDAKVTIVEFSDYQCPFCGRFFRETYRLLLSEYIQTGRVRYVVKDFPIESIHPFAFKAAEAVHCAADEGKYWEMHDALFASQHSLTLDGLQTRASAIGLDSLRFQQCLKTSRHANVVRRGLNEGQRVGVTGTPAFFVTLTKPGDIQARALYGVRGAKSFAEFKRIVDAALAAAEAP